MALRLLRFPRNCSHTWFQRTFVVTFCVRASHADVYPELLQDAQGPETTSKMAHRIVGAALLLSHPVVELARCLEKASLATY